MAFSPQAGVSNVMGFQASAVLGQDQAATSRPRFLTNSAAEFIETRAEEALGLDPASHDLEFLPELDRFTSKSRKPKFGPKCINYYKESEAKANELREILGSFCRKLETRGLDKKLGVAIKNPEAYSMDDVLQVAEALCHQHKNSDKVRGWMGAIRRGFRITSSTRTVIQTLLTFVPSDVYGSVICGGFTVALSALEHSEAINQDICAALADIPRKLDEVRNLAEVHFRSPELMLRADSVFVAIFAVLERIINELSKRSAKKAVSLTFQGNNYASDLRHTLDRLENKIQEFKAEAHICAQKRLGRIEDIATKNLAAAENNSTVLTDLRGRFEMSQKEYQADKAALMLALENTNQNVLGNGQLLDQQVKHMSLQLSVLDNFYALFASSPLFNPRNGTLDVQRAEGLVGDGPPAPRPAEQNAKRLKGPESNGNSLGKSTLHKWLKSFSRGDAQARCLDDIKDSLRALWGFSLQEMDQVRWLMTSVKLQSWLRSTDSGIVVLEAESAPADLANPLSFTTAFLAHSLTRSSVEGSCHVLTYFCGLRAVNDASSSAVIDMLNSLNGQLLAHISHRRRDQCSNSLSLSPASPLLHGSEWYRRKCQRSTGAAVDLLQQLLGHLPEGDVVFVLVDSVSRLACGVDEIEKGIGKLVNIVRTGTASSAAVVKVLISDPLSTCSIQGTSFAWVRLPDHVDGDREGVNMEVLEGAILPSLQNTGLGRDHLEECSESE